MRVAFLALLAVFALSALTAASALASPEWYVKKGGTFSKVSTAVKVTWEGSFGLVDTGYAKEHPPSQLGFSCKKGAEGSGEITAAGKGSMSAFKVSNPESNCEKVKESVCGSYSNINGFELPWQTELYTEGTEIRQQLLKQEFEPKVRFRCKVGGVTLEDGCSYMTTTHMRNSTLPEYIVEAEFDAKSAKTGCEKSSEKASGEYKGTLKIKPTAAEKEKGVEGIKVE
jgi:hypothetical protein